MILFVFCIVDNWWVIMMVVLFFNSVLSVCWIFIFVFVLMFVVVLFKMIIWGLVNSVWVNEINWCFFMDKMFFCFFIFVL